MTIEHLNSGEILSQGTATVAAKVVGWACGHSCTA